MGSLTSRQNVGVEEVDIASNHAYKYPPKSGNYFASHFIMGGERFDTPQPEAYLFGENVDLNFLGSKPTPFPYPPPQANEPTKTLRSLVNIRKESVRFVKAPESVVRENFPDDVIRDNKFNIEFVFDCDSNCAITIYYFCSEEVTSSGLVYTPKDPTMTSQTFHYKRGANQLFSQPSHIFDPTKFYDDELTYDLEREVIPIAIHCVAESNAEGDQSHQSHATYAVIDRHADGTYVLRALKQKLYVDGLCYLLQEIYGIENKNFETIKGVNDEETEDNGSECVVCMCDVRDTLILPCKHFCLCNSCADSLRYQANNCPICRAPFRALLQIRALQKTSASESNPAIHEEVSFDHVPLGYRTVSLIEALNGPCTLRPTTCHDMAESPVSESAVQAAEMLNRSNNSDEAKKSASESGSLHRLSASASSTPEFRMSVLLPREDGSKSSPSLCRRNSSKRKDRPVDDEYCNEEKVATEPDQCFDGDSDAEKLSPLLVTKKIEPKVEQSHSDKDIPNHYPEPEKKTPTQVGGDKGEDSDYYTPEDPTPTTLNPLGESDKDQPIPSSVESTPGRIHPRDYFMTVSLPGTPISTSSHLSARSSGDSYSSTSSTRHLLAHNLANKQEKVPTSQTNT